MPLLLFWCVINCLSVDVNMNRTSNISKLVDKNFVAYGIFLVRFMQMIVDKLDNNDTHATNTKQHFTARMRLSTNDGLVS